MISKAQKRFKRLFDLCLVLCALPLVLPLLTVLILLATLDTGQWAWFLQPRIGQYGKAFSIYKIRSLRGKTHALGTEAQYASTFGNWLRRTNLDELPQVFNVLFGQMSLVGPRPDLPGFADRLEGEDRLILSIRPGITGPASLKYRKEAELLSAQSDPERYYHEVIWPDKVEINKSYVKTYSFYLDLQLLLETLL